MPAACDPVAPYADAPPALTEREHALLAAFLTRNDAVSAFLASTSLAPAELLAFTSSPAVKAHLAAILALSHARLALRAAEARITAISTLESVVAAAEDPIEKRRAASALFRATASPLIPLTLSAASTSHDHDPRDERDTPPEPTARPHPSLTPMDVTDLLLDAFSEPDDPEPDAGLATVLAFATPDAVFDGAPMNLVDPTALDTLRDAPIASALADADHATRWYETRPTPTSDTSAAGRVILSIGRDQHQLDITLTRSPTNPADLSSPAAWRWSSIATTLLNTS